MLKVVFRVERTLSARLLLSFLIQGLWDNKRQRLYWILLIHVHVKSLKHPLLFYSKWYAQFREELSED